MSQPTTLPASKLQRADPRHVHLVAVGLLPDALEVQQTQGQRERHESSEDAPPEHQLVSQPSGPRTTTDEALGEELRADQGRQSDQVGALAPAERIPTPAVEHRRRRATNPHRVAVDDAKHGEHQSEQIADQGGVEPHQAVAAQEGEGKRDRDGDQPPGQAPSIERLRRRLPHNSHRRSDRSRAVTGPVRLGQLARRSPGSPDAAGRNVHLGSGLRRCLCSVVAAGGALDVPEQSPGDVDRARTRRCLPLARMLNPPCEDVGVDCPDRAKPAT